MLGKRGSGEAWGTGSVYISISKELLTIPKVVRST
jgi:hypothetical protein